MRRDSAHEHEHGAPPGVPLASLASLALALLLACSGTGEGSGPSPDSAADAAPGTDRIAPADADEGGRLAPARL